MRTFSYCIVLLLLINNSSIAQQNPDSPTNISIIIKNDIPSIDIIFPDKNIFTSSICFQFTTQKDTSTITDVSIDIDNISPQPKTLIKRSETTKTENLNFSLISWSEDLEVSETKETRKFYIVFLKSSNLTLFWVETESALKALKINAENKNISLPSTNDSIIFDSYQKMKTLILPLVPTVIEPKENNTIHLIKRQEFVPNIFGVLIAFGENPSLSADSHPSDLGTKYGIQINATTYNPSLHNYNIFITPGDTVLTYDRKRIEFWGKVCIIEREGNLYQSLNFIHIHAFSYKDKYNQWTLSFYSPITGYLRLNGKINTIFNSLLYADSTEKQIKGICQIEKSDYFDFEIPKCIESRILIPESIVLKQPPSTKK